MMWGWKAYGGEYDVDEDGSDEYAICTLGSSCMFLSHKTIYIEFHNSSIYIYIKKKCACLILAN